MTFKEKIKHIRSQVLTGKVVDFYPYTVEYAEDIVRIRNQPEVKYFLAQGHSITLEQQIAWIQRYEQSEDEFGFIIKNKRNEVIGINFCFDFDPGTNSMEMGRGTFDLSKIVGMAYTLETISMTTDLAFNFLQIDSLRSVIKSDNLRLLKFFKKMNWTITGQCMIRQTEYNSLELRKGESRHMDYAHILESRQNKVVG